MSFRPELLDPASVEGLRRSFDTAAPFPHLVLHDVLTEDSSDLLEAFPEPEWDGWFRFGDAYQHRKMSCSDIARIPAPLAGLINELSQPEFLTFLEKVTGIPRLLVDPYLEGGGLHCSGPDGVLIPHTDFHLYPRLGLYRRINVLVYLNPDWEESWGGSLQLFEPGTEKAVKSVVPRLGDCVIFRTDDNSRHGFTQPVQAPHWRRSVALYYYTADEAEGFSGDTSTHWSQVPAQGTFNRIRQRAYQLLIMASRGFAFFAHRVDPNLSARRSTKE